MSKYSVTFPGRGYSDQMLHGTERENTLYNELFYHKQRWNGSGFIKMDTKLLLLKTHSKSKRGRGGSVSPISDLPYPIISIHITVMATLSSELHINKPYHRHWLASITLPDNPVMCCQCCGQTHTLFARSQSPHSSLPLYQTCKRCLTRPKLFVFVNLSVGNVEYTG